MNMSALQIVYDALTGEDRLVPPMRNAAERDRAERVVRALEAAGLLGLGYGTKEPPKAISG
jgi:hypothetical protein